MQNTLMPKLLKDDSLYPVGAEPIVETLTTHVRSHGAGPVTKLADEVLRASQSYVRATIEDVELAGPFVKRGIARDYRHPPQADFVAGQWFADDRQNPLRDGEQWNAAGTRRATMSGVSFGVDHRGWAVNPYLDAGVDGPGMFGLIGPNPVIDLVTIIPRKLSGKLEAWGAYIIGPTGQAATVGGHFKFPQATQDPGPRLITPGVVALSRRDEFFEEIMSGSIELRDEWAQTLAQKFPDPAANPVAYAEQAAILKMEMLQDIDPRFVETLGAHFTKAQTLFAGPVIMSGRNTNTSWTESNVGMSIVTPELMEDLRRTMPPDQNYGFAAGDDAKGSLCGRIDSTLLRRMLPSHRPFTAAALAAYALDQRAQFGMVSVDILAQMEEVRDYLRNPDALPDLPPDFSTSPSINEALGLEA